MTLTWPVITLLVTLVCTLVVVHSTSLPAAAVHRSSPPHRVLLDNEPLRNPCGSEMRQQAPAAFTITFTTNYYGSFTAACERVRAPVWVDRIYNLARLGYFSDNYFLRVVNSSSLRIVQFGTSGVPLTANVYNYSTSSQPECAILRPQPPEMPRCMAEAALSRGCPASGEAAGLSNTYGTLSMSTSSEQTAAFPKGVTWNATAELFLNTGDNSWLDPLLFVPVCTIDAQGMQAVRRFPSFGELADLGGPGPSLGLLYEFGNAYIEANASWARMGQVSQVHVGRGRSAVRGATRREQA